MKTKAKPLPATFTRRDLGRTQGFYWHIHHHVLAELCWDISGRRFYVKHDKPKTEVKTRLRLMKPIRTNGAPVWLKKLWAEFLDEQLDHKEVCAVFSRHKASVERLHRQQCKRCPWDGWTIFP